MTINTDALQAFMTRARQAARTGSKEFRMTAAEGAELAAAVGEVLTQNIALRQRLAVESEITSKAIVVDGGGLGR